jgi:hypothetical protein
MVSHLNAINELNRICEIPVCQFPDGLVLREVAQGVFLEGGIQEMDKQGIRLDIH